MTRPSNELVDILRSSALENIIELKHQLDPQNGWSELVAPEENEKGWARKLVEKHEWLQKLFHNVSDSGPYQADITNADAYHGPNANGNFSDALMLFRASSLTLRYKWIVRKESC